MQAQNSKLQRSQSIHLNALVCEIYMISLTKAAKKALKEAKKTELLVAERAEKERKKERREVIVS